MASRLRSILSVLFVLALAGCDLGSTVPVSIELEFVPNHKLNANGTCSVSFVARATGFGSAQWTRVVVRRGGSAIATYEGAQTAQFWGSQSISAGEVQPSTPFDAPQAADVLVEVSYRIGGPERGPVQLRPSCPSS